jgi:MFS family permease
VATAGPAAALRLIRDRNFGPYFVGNAASASGTWFQNLAASILVYRLTGSAFLLGVLNFANFVPVLVLAPWAGSAADRFDRRQVLLTTQLVAAALSGVTGRRLCLARGTGSDSRAAARTSP